MQAEQIRRELAALWQAWLDRVLASLVSAGPGAPDRELVALDRLQLLQRFLPQQANTLPLAEAAPIRHAGGVSQLCALLQCQSRLQQEAGAVAAPAGLLQQQLQQGLLKLAHACRHSDWTLHACVGSGLARLCRELVLLAGFAGIAQQSQQLATLEARLLLLHAAPQAPSLPRQAQLQKQLLALARGRAGLCQLPQPQACSATDAGLALPEAVGHAECSQLVAQLQPLPGTSVDVAESWLFACYRLAWVLRALGRTVLADTGLLIWHLLVQHWQQRAPLPAPVQALLAAWQQLVLQDPLQHEQQTPAAMRPEVPAALCALLGPALACWPDKRGNARTSRYPPLQGSPAPVLPAHGEGLPALRQLPEYLAASLSALLAVEAGWFAGRSHWESCTAALQAELQLLEQGAAALRLSALEEFCSLLLGLHLLLDTGLPQGEWPGELLWRAHHELVALLDRAALWLEPLPAASTLSALRGFQQQSEERCTDLLRAQVPLTPVQRLAAALSLFCLQAGRLLARPVRIRLVAPPAVPAVLESALLHTLQEILRWLLLQHESSAELRRSQRLALATTLELTLQPLAAEACMATVLETGVRGLPGAKALQRLQRSLGAAVDVLQCEELPRVGRRVRCCLSAATLQRAQDLRYRGERPLLQI